MAEPAVPFYEASRVLLPLKAELTAALERCLGHGTFVLGPEVERFEKGLAEYLGVAHAVGVSSGTDALLATFQALQLDYDGLAPLRPGDEILTTPFSFISSATSILRAGLRPVFADVARGALHPGATELEQAWTPRTRAVLVVHLFGEPLDLEGISALCAARGAVLIEDCAQAIGARYAQGPLHGGSVGRRGAAGCFSFFPAKNLGALGDGGAVITGNPRLAARVREQRQHGQAKRYQFDSLGGNFRLDALQAAFLGTLLPHLDGWIADRRRRARHYLAALGDLAARRPELLTLPRDCPEHGWNQFVVRSQERNHLKEVLQAAGVPTQIYYPSALHQQGALASAQPPATLAETERACQEVLALPIAPGLSAAEEQRVIDAVLSAW